MLSCEVGAAKPDAAIYRIAVDRLGASPECAVLVDDQLVYCQGAMALGMRAVQIVRDGVTAAVGSIQLEQPIVVPSCAYLNDALRWGVAGQRNHPGNHKRR